MEDIETVVSAMEIVYIKRLMVKMTEIAGKLPKPRPDDPDMKAYTVIYKDLAALAEISSLRARYVRRVHVDPECKKDIDEMWQRTIKLIN